MKYYLMNNGAQQSGPFELNDLLGNGLTPQSYVWNETMSNWLPAMQVPEVAAMLNTQQCPSMPVNNAKEVGFTDALGICFKKYATFTGRARRSEYWWFFLWLLYLDLVHLWFGSNCVVHTIHFRHLSSASRHRT